MVVVKEEEVIEYATTEKVIFICKVQGKHLYRYANNRQTRMKEKKKRKCLGRGFRK